MPTAHTCKTIVMWLTETIKEEWQNAKVTEITYKHIWNELCNAFEIWNDILPVEESNY